LTQNDKKNQDDTTAKEITSKTKNPKGESQDKSSNKKDGKPAKKGLLSSLLGSTKKGDAKAGKGKDDPKKGMFGASKGSAQQSEGVIEGIGTHVSVDRGIKKERLAMRYQGTIIRGCVLSCASVLFLMVLGIGYFAITIFLPEPDSDRDGVPDVDDICPGHDDYEDVDHDGISDGCDDIITPTNFDEIVLSDQSVLPSQSGVYDVFFKLQNKNREFGIGNLVVVISLYDAKNELMDQRVVDTYVNVDSERVVIAPRFILEREPQRVEAEVTSGTWSDPATDQEVFLDLEDENFEVLNEPNLYSKLTGTITNDSDFDLAEVEVQALILDNNKDVISVNFTSVKTLSTDETRAFIIRWPEPFEEEMARYELQISTNTMSTNNLLQRRGGEIEF